MADEVVPGDRGCLLPRATAVTRGDGATVLVCGDEGDGVSTVTAELVARGAVLLPDQTPALDAVNLEVTALHEPVAPSPDVPLEVRLLIIARRDDRAGDVEVRRLPEGEAAHALGSRCERLGEVSGGPLPALARVARRVPAYELRYADPRRAAEEVTTLWQES